MVTTDIYICPRCCNAKMVATIEVEEKWVIDEQGNLLEKIGSNIDSAADYLDIRCSKCKSSATEVTCHEAMVYAENTPASPLLGTAYIPVDDDAAIYWKENGGSSVQCILIQGKENDRYFWASDRKIYIEENEELFVEQECHGQIMMNRDEIL